VKPIYISTPHSPGECRRRLAERVGKARWRWQGTGLGRYCDRALCGAVDPHGFDVAETTPKGLVISDPRIRGRWANVGGRTIVRLRLYSKWYEWAGTAVGSALLGSAVAALGTSAFGSLSLSAFCLMALCCAAVVMGLLLKRRHVRMTSRAKDLGPRAAAMFEGEILAESLGLHFEMELDGR